MDMNNAPIIKIPGSDTWSDSYELGQYLSSAFPGHGCYDLAMAVAYNKSWPDNAAIRKVVMLEEGCNDGPAWLWAVKFSDDNGESYWMIGHGWCDYTGWDCQSGFVWSEKYASYGW